MTITKCHFSIFCEPAVRICICCFKLVWRKEGRSKKNQYWSGGKKTGVMEVKLSVHVLFSVCYHLIVDEYLGLFILRWRRLKNPRLRTHHLLYECKTVLFYGVPIVQIFRHADEHDQLTSLRCLCCKVNVAKITVFFFSFFLCVSMNIACFGWEEEKKIATSHKGGVYTVIFFQSKEVFSIELMQFDVNNEGRLK